MSLLTYTRLKKEWDDWQDNPMRGATLVPQQNFMYLIWKCSVRGKRETIWSRGVYNFWMYLKNYPTSPPMIFFWPPVFHPNISADGKLWSSLLTERSGWTETRTLKDIFVYIRELLYMPCIPEAVNHKARLMYLGNRGLYIKRILRQANDLRGVKKPRRRNRRHRRHIGALVRRPR